MHMKVCLLLILVFVAACGNSALDEAKKMRASLEAAKKQFTPGTVSTTSDGYFMKATVNGEQWTATHMMPDENPESNLKRIFGENEDASISFSVYMPGIAAGKTFEFSENNAVDFSPADDGFFGGSEVAGIHEPNHVRR